MSAGAAFRAQHLSLRRGQRHTMAPTMLRVVSRQMRTILDDPIGGPQARALLEGNRPQIIDVVPRGKG